MINISSPNRHLCLGKIHKEKGLVGELKVMTFGSFLLDYKKADSLSLFKSLPPLDGFLREPVFFKQITIESIKQQNQFLVMRFVGIPRIEDAQKLVGYYIGLPIQDAFEKFVVAAKDDVPYLFEYIDMQVISPTGEDIGIISRIEELGLNTLFVIILKDSSKEVLIPANLPNIKNIDRQKRTMSIENIEDFIV